MITPKQLRAIMPLAPQERIAAFTSPLNDAMGEYQITSMVRQAAFLAQIAHESAELRYVLELSSGGDYEGRLDLGNVLPGDGPRFKGRGLLQITGRANYKACGVALHLDLVDLPSILETPPGACRSAAWYWSTRGLNELADADLYGAITKRINGGFNGIDSRLKYWLRARKVFSL